MTDSAIAVLDIDGTLIDSNDQHVLAWYRALRSVGETYPVWRLHRIVGMGGDQARKQQGKEVDALEEMAPLPGARDIAADWTTSADVEAAKPAPDLLRVALKKLGAPSAPLA
jgi:beta-phosphoglucomutase-like phosphatase (HAD superfamily)